MIHLEHQVFSGFVYTFTFYDILSYLAKMRDGYDGAWFYTNPFTTEDIKPVFLFVFYIALGHAARLAGLSLVAAYHLARVASGLLLLAAVDRMIRRLGWSGPTRLLAFALVFFAGGFGWLLYWTGRASVPVEFMQTEGFVFQSMVSYPHFVLALALMVITLTGAADWGRGERGPRPLIASALAAFLLAWVHPRPLLTLVVTIALAAAFTAVRDRQPRALLRAAVFIAALLAASALPMIVSLRTVRADPLWTEWSTTETLSEPFGHYLLAYGLLWPLALAGLVLALRRREAFAPWLGAWLIAGSLLPYLPIAAQGRLIIGWNIPLALLSAYALGAGWLPRALRSAPPLRPLAPLLLTLLLILLSLSPLAYLGHGVKRVLLGSYPGYYAAERAEAMQWLAANTRRDDTVLASTLSGMFVPALAGNRVVQGHWAETFHPEEKARAVSRIFDDATPDADRRHLLDGFGVRYLLYGQWERELGAYDPALDPGLWSLRWEGAATRIYERRNTTSPP